MQRKLTKSGLNVQENQYVSINPMKHETIVLASNNQANWGSMTQFDFREKDLYLHRLILSYNVGAITGLTGTVSNYPRFQPANYFFDRIEILVSGNVVQTILPDSVIFRNNLFQIDAERQFFNLGVGSYASAAHRAALAATTSTYNVDLSSFVSQSRPLICNSNHNVTVKVYNTAITNVVEQSTLTGTPVAVMNPLYLLIDISRVSSEFAQSHNALLYQRPQHNLYPSCIQTSYPVQAGATAGTFLLNNVVGRVLYVLILLRDTTVSVRSPASLPISSFNILSSSGSSLIGGQAIARANYMTFVKNWGPSSFLTENSLGTTNNNINLAMFSFCGDPTGADQRGVFYNSYKFVGTEQLQLVFPTCTNVCQVDVLTFIEAAVEFSGTTSKQIIL
jgi:hypothetical protein